MATSNLTFSSMVNPLLTQSAPSPWHQMADAIPKEFFEASFLPITTDNPPTTPRLDFATPMSVSSKKFGTRRFHSLESANSRQNRRSRLFALFGPGVEETGENAQSSTSASQGPSHSANSSVTPSEQLDELLSPGNIRQTENGVNAGQNSASAGVSNQAAAGGDKKAIESTASHSVSFTQTSKSNFTNNDKMRISDDQADNGGNLGDGSSAEIQSTPNKTRLPIHRHKRNESATKIVDQNSADAVILPSSSYHSPAKVNRDMLSTDKTEPASTIAQPLLTTKSYTLNQKPAENSTLLPSTFYATSALPPRVLPDIPEENRQPQETASLLPSTSYNTSAPAHGILKDPVEEKKTADKKVHFEAVTARDTEDDDYDSDDSDKTVKAGVGGMKAAVPQDSGLSPAIWDKSSEPKIWMKDGKPTLFKPTKDPGYYTCPLWSRQYPEILSNDPPKVSSYGANYADSIISQDGSQASSSSTDTTYNAASQTATQHSRFATFPRSTDTYPPPIDYDNIPVMPPMPPGFVYPPVYRSHVTLEVGGRRFVSSIPVLERSPYFKYMLAIPFMEWYRGGVLHIDNDPDLFAHILRYLRTGNYPFFWDARNGFDYAMYAMILQQARFYLLPKLEAWIMHQKYLNVIQSEVMHRKIEVLEDQDWVSKQKLAGNDTYEIAGVVSSRRGADSRHGKLKAFGVGKQENNEEQSSDSKEERTEMESLQVFTTSKKMKVNMGLLHCEYKSQFP